MYPDIQLIVYMKREEVGDDNKHSKVHSMYIGCANLAFTFLPAYSVYVVTCMSKFLTVQKCPNVFTTQPSRSSHAHNGLTNLIQLSPRLTGASMHLVANLQEVA